MPKAIMLDIVRKTKVPTKKQLVHMYRSDWKPIYRISYEDSKRLFKVMSGKIETEQQFCKWVLDRFGEGIYYFRLMKKGLKGFRSFLYVELTKNKFRRLKPYSRIKKGYEKIKLKSDIKEKEIEINELKGDDKEDAEDDIQFMKEDLEDLDDSKKGHFPYPYLKSAQPVYSWHDYESTEREVNNQEEMQRVL